MKRSIYRRAGLTSRLLLISTGLALPFSAIADLKDLIAQTPPDRVSVIIPVAESPDNDYGILTLSKTDFADAVGLKDPNLLENDFFRVVENQNDETLGVSDFDGRNVLYHMTMARRKYLEFAEHDIVRPSFFHQALVRVRADHAFNGSVHFADANQYNNSAYITANDPKWGNEVWFNARKSQMKKTDWYSVGLGTGASLMTKNWLSLANPLPDFINKYDSGMDSAKLPNVIYHETFHYVSDVSEMIPSPYSGNQIGEDYANYFAASLFGKPYIAELGEFSGRFYKRNYKKIHEFKDDGNESLNNFDYNWHGFVPSVLWSIRQKIGAQKANQLIWNSIKYLKGGSFQTRVPTAILRAAQEDSDLTADDLQFLEAQFNRYYQSFANIQKHFFGKLVLDEDAEASPSLLAQAKNEADKLRAVPNALKIQGIDLSPEEAKQFADAADQLEQESKKRGFLKKVMHALSGFGIQVGEKTGYALGAVASSLNAPVRYGTELVVDTTTGHPMRNYQIEKVGNQLSGAAGGLGMMYYLDVGLSTIGNPLPISLSLTGVTLAEGMVCAHQKTTKKAELKKFCEENSKIINSINTHSSHAGDVSGEKVRNFFRAIGRHL